MKMQNIIRIIFIILLNFYTIGFSQIIQTNDTQVIHDTLKLIDRHTIVVFDVDNVIILPNDKILRSENTKTYNQLLEPLKQKFGTQQIKNLRSIILSKRKSSIVDHEIPKIIENLQNSNVKVLALTNSPTGEYGVIANREDWRIDELTKHKIYFHKSWLNIADTSLKHFMQNTIAANPVYKQGIIFTDKYDKGQVLEAFLKHAKLKPSKIIFIDDKLNRLESVDKLAKKKNIKFVGIMYTKASKGKSVLDYDIAKLQFDHLSNKHIWLSDAQARDLLNTKLDKN